jgi:hypothetical protein
LMAQHLGVEEYMYILYIYIYDPAPAYCVQRVALSILSPPKHASTQRPYKQETDV